MIFLNKYSLLILIVYCTPFAFLSMYDDLTNKSMIVYGLSIVVFGVFAFMAKKKSSLMVLLLANGVTFVHSYYWVTRTVEFEEKGYYFAPFTPVNLVIFVTVLFVLLQLVVFFLTKPSSYKEKNPRQRAENA